LSIDRAVVDVVIGLGLVVRVLVVTHGRVEGLGLLALRRGLVILEARVLDDLVVGEGSEDEDDEAADLDPALVGEHLPPNNEANSPD